MIQHAVSTKEHHTLSPLIWETAALKSTSRLLWGWLELTRKVDILATRANMSKTRQTSPPPPLKFITITEEPESMKNEFSYTVRSHAMQSFIHERKNRKTKQAKPGLMQSSDSNIQVQSPHELSGRFKLSTWSRKSRKKVLRVAEQKKEELGKAASLAAIAEVKTVFKIAICSK